MRANTIRVEHTLTPAQFDAVVETWNRKPAPDKREIAQRCRSQGHRLAITPFSTDTRPIRVCVRCTWYVRRDK